MKLSPLEIKHRDTLLAHFLGWFKEDDQPETWYNHLYEGKEPVSKYVVYSEYKDPFKGLPFNHDLKYLFQVLEQVRAKVFSLGKQLNYSKPFYCIDELEISMNRVWCKIFQWDGQEWKMPSCKGENEHLFISYNIGEECTNHQEALYMLLTDVVSVLLTTDIPKH